MSTDTGGDNATASGAGRVRFYQLSGASLESTLARLCAKTLERGWRALVVSRSQPWLEHLDDFLWLHPPEGFLPHGRCGSPHAARQPVLLCPEIHKENQADVLFVADGRLVEMVGEFTLVVDFVPPGERDAARQRYVHYRSRGCALEYWVQTPGGGWEQPNPRSASGVTAGR
ncbi:MAG: DNA polymerase III subunit chi [Magnetococcus sp. WYHC-3]